jgi:hypothetical protein
MKNIRQPAMKYPLILSLISKQNIVITGENLNSNVIYIRFVLQIAVKYHV